MRPVALFLAAALSVLAQTKSTCEDPREFPFQPSGELRLDLRSGDVDIIGTDRTGVRVSCELKETDRLNEVRVEFKSKGTLGELKVKGGPSNEFRMRVEVPANSHLWVRVPAGDVDIKGVTGNKDIEVRAGDLKIDVGNAADYAKAQASVRAGGLNAAPFGIHKGGLFRSFSRENPAGKFTLRAHLTAGDLTLR
jgi:hypothetical protein